MSASKLEAKFLAAWQESGLPWVLYREYYPFPSRRHRIDFAIPSRQVGIEIHGGIWMRGRHVTGTGFSDDCEKRNLLALHEWAVFELTPEMLKGGELKRWLDLIAATVAKRPFFTAHPAVTAKNDRVKSKILNEPSAKCPTPSPSGGASAKRTTA